MKIHRKVINVSVTDLEVSTLPFAATETTLVYLDVFTLSSFAYVVMNNTITCLVESKPVYKEVSCTVKLSIKK